MLLELALVYIGVVLMYFVGFCVGYSKRTEQEFTEDWDIDDLSEKDINKIINFYNGLKGK